VLLQKGLGLELYPLVSALGRCCDFCVEIRGLPLKVCASRAARIRRGREAACGGRRSPADSVRALRGAYVVDTRPVQLNHLRSDTLSERGGGCPKPERVSLLGLRQRGFGPRPPGCAGAGAESRL